jgi:hypothetical protein
MKTFKKIVSLLLFIPVLLIGQDDLLGELENELQNDKTDVTAVFKGIKIVNFESTKLVGKNQLQFIISHRFGALNDGIDNFLGLDQATARIQFIYGFTDGLHASISRSGFNKTYDAALKYKIISQRADGFPFTIVGYNLINVNTDLDRDILPGLTFNDRLGYASQVLISRKFNDFLSLQLAPTYFHDNTVVEDGQRNAQFALGIGGRVKFTKRMAFIGDYGLHLNRVDNSVFNNALSLGLEIETGGHVFQIHVSNSQAIFANGFLGQARGDFSDGSVFLGFNISRAFSF